MGLDFTVRSAAVQVHFCLVFDAIKIPCFGDFHSAVLKEGGYCPAISAIPGSVCLIQSLGPDLDAGVKDDCNEFPIPEGISARPYCVPSTGTDPDSANKN
ncbi:hypothetical protein TcasGA2_TC007122 [Tribolium castaneum]|uniref:Uncharacterized protein n=1 Tax=Tribolium castaneum TaxID=7070 RepID=D2A1A6_TRICA|nr:hypothetical protein TcasGA2_TC007122 [Tribolium castaneum]